MPTLPESLIEAQKRIIKYSQTEGYAGVCLALNIHDAERMDPEMRVKMLKGRVDLGRVVDMRFDRTPEAKEAAVVFTCDLLSAAIIIDLLRSHDREAGDFATRAYIKKNAWGRIPSNVVLTIKNGDQKTSLNPEIFGNLEGARPVLVPPAVKPLI